MKLKERINKRKAVRVGTYLELIEAFPLKAIRTKMGFEQAMKMVSRLAIWEEGTLSDPEQDYLDAMVILLEAYDRDHRVKLHATGLDVLRQFMEERHLTVSDLGKIVGSQPLASMILSGKREMSKDVMRRLGAYFDVDAGIFM